METTLFELNARLHHIGARTIDVRYGAIVDIRALHCEHERWNYFKHADMRPIKCSVLLRR